MLGDLIEHAARDVQAVLDRKLSTVGVAVRGSALDQAGLQDGSEIVSHYLRVGESQLAYDHLLYMVEALEAELPAETAALIDKAGRLLSE